MSMMYTSNEDNELFYPNNKEEDGGVDYFEWCASFLTVPPTASKDGILSTPPSSGSSSASSCSSNPPSERSSPNVSPYSSPEQYQPPSPDVSMQYTAYEPYNEELAHRVVVPQLFQTINIGLVQQYPGHHGHTPHPSLHHSGAYSAHRGPVVHQISHTPHPHSHPHPHPHAPVNNQLVEASRNKELLVIDHSKEMQKRKAVVLEVTPVGSEVPEFVFCPAEGVSGDVARITMRPSCQLPQSFYRNCYEMLRMRLPGDGFEGYRVYVHNKLGYSGNAKRFKQGPDAGERAFVLEGEILNQNMEPIVQCQACEEYFRDASRRILLIKNNVPIHVKNGEFQLQLKLMCCSSHHNSPFYFHFSLYDHMTKRVALNSVFAVNVKQWKNMGSTGSKRRKTDGDR